jgi:hypothetical protein
MTSQKTKKTAAVEKAVKMITKKIPAKKAARTNVKKVLKSVDKKLVTLKKAKKINQLKVVRDSFTMPQAEYQKIADIKASCAKAGMPVKKSEVLRAGLLMLSLLDAAEMKTVFGKLEKIATGRPKKG